MTQSVNEAAPLALRPHEAAKRLGISQRTLAKYTAAGEVPHTRLGRAVLYPVPALEAWLASRAREVGHAR